jgi:hypothetical protein
LEIFYELLWLSLKFGRISGYFQYPVSGHISGKTNPVSGRIPDIKKGRVIRLDIRCIPSHNLVPVFGRIPEVDIKDSGLFCPFFRITAQPKV